MRFAGIVLIVLGISVIWLLGIEGLTPDQAIQHVGELFGLGQPASGQDRQGGGQQ